MLSIQITFIAVLAIAHAGMRLLGAHPLQASHAIETCVGVPLAIHSSLWFAEQLSEAEWDPCTCVKEVDMQGLLEWAHVIIAWKLSLLIAFQTPLVMLDAACASMMVLCAKQRSISGVIFAAHWIYFACLRRVCDSDRMPMELWSLTQIVQFMCIIALGLGWLLAIQMDLTC